MSNFRKRHPYWHGLLKRSVTIVVTWNVVVLCIFGTIITFGIFGAISSGESYDEPEIVVNHIYGEGFNEILSIKISGVILGSSEEDDLSSFFLEPHTYGYDVKDQLYYAAYDDTISGVILEIDSPGGTIFGSRAIADGVEYYKKTTGKPVYAHIQGMGDSGAYWAASSTDKIFSDYGSDVGSIGVIMGPFEYYDRPIASNGGLLGGGVITQNGIESTYVSSGKSKDLGNPYRRLTQTELRTLQEQVNNEYDDFVSYVSRQRQISGDTIRNKIGAMTYGPKTALELKLIDHIGSRQDAYDAVADAAGVLDDYFVASEGPEPLGLLDTLFGAFSNKQEPTVSKLNLCKLSTPLAYHGDITKQC